MLETTTTVLERDAKEQETDAAKTQDRKSSSRGKKSSTAYRTISEVAGELNLPQHVLRFWESKFKQVEPMKRGGGRRYYAPKDVDTLKKIHFLLYTKGYTIKGAKKLLSSRKDISPELVGIEQKFKLFEPIVIETSPEPVVQSAPQESGSTADMFGFSPVDGIKSELKLILADLKALRKTIS